MLTAMVMALAFFGGHPPMIKKTNIRVAGWTMTLRKDNFTGAVSCGAKRGDVSLVRSVAVFALGSDVDTSDAVYRLDAGAAHSVHEVTLRTRTLGAPLTLEPIDNPSRGLVVLPLADISDVNAVWIRATPKTPPKRFIVTGVKSVLDQEQLKACSG